MKKSLTRNFMLLSAVSMTMLASAQQRQVDLEIHIEEPANASALQSGETFSLVLSVTNHGPEELLEGDTLFIVLPTREVTSGVMSSPIAVGENYVLATEYELTAPVTETSGEFELCVQLADDPSTQISDNTGNPILVSYKDPDPSNNLICHVVAVEAQSSSIAAQPDDGLNLYPNPTHNYIRIPVDPSLSEPIRIRILDAVGRTVFTQRYTESGLSTLEVNVEQLQEGIYILERQQGPHRNTGKFTIYR